MELGRDGLDERTADVEEVLSGETGEDLEDPSGARRRTGAVLGWRGGSLTRRSVVARWIASSSSAAIPSAICRCLDSASRSTLAHDRTRITRALDRQPRRHGGCVDIVDHRGVAHDSACLGQGRRHPSVRSPPKQRERHQPEREWGQQLMQPLVERDEAEIGRVG